jgi:hypothetical protein
VEHQPRPKLKEDRKIHGEKVSDKKLCEHQHQLLRAEFISASASEQRMRGNWGGQLQREPSKLWAEIFEPSIL